MNTKMCLNLYDKELGRTLTPIEIMIDILGMIGLLGGIVAMGLFIFSLVTEGVFK